MALMRWTPFRRTGEAQKCHNSISPDTSALYCTVPAPGVEVISTKTVSGVAVGPAGSVGAGAAVSVAGGAPHAASNPTIASIHITPQRRFLKLFMFLLLFEIR